MKNKFWEFKKFVPNEVADLYIYNEISSWDDENFTSANSFKQELDTLGDIKTINLYINSPGGSVADGLAIASMLKRHKAYVIAHVDSMACSIASVIVCSCDKVIMPKNTLLMIHNALMGGFFYGNAKDFRKQAIKSGYITKINAKQARFLSGFNEFSKPVWVDMFHKEKLMDLNVSNITNEEIFEENVCEYEQEIFERMFPN